MLDAAILTVAALTAIASRNGLVVAVWCASNMLLLLTIDTSGHSVYWETMAAWAVLFSIKDFFLMAYLGWYCKSLIIVYSLAASCVFHQVLSWQIFTHNWESVTLLGYRPDFMLYLSVIMLATVIHELTRGNKNGGKRIVNYLHVADRRFRRLFHVASQKNQS